MVIKYFKMIQSSWHSEVKIISTMMLLVFYITCTLCQRITCSTAQGPVDISSTSVTCKDANGGEISQTINDRAINVVGSSTNDDNVVTISNSNLNVFFSSTSIKSLTKAAFKADSNSIVTIHMIGNCSFEGNSHGIGCEGGSSVRMKGADGSYVNVLSSGGTAFGSIDGTCQKLELNDVNGNFNHSPDSGPNGAAIGSGKIDGNEGSVSHILILNSNITTGSGA